MTWDRGVGVLPTTYRHMSTGRLDLGPKKAACAAYGVAEFWAIYPSIRTIQIFRLADSAEAPAVTLKEADALMSSALPGFQVALAKLFST